MGPRSLHTRMLLLSATIIVVSSSVVFPFLVFPFLVFGTYSTILVIAIFCILIQVAFVFGVAVVLRPLRRLGDAARVIAGEKEFKDGQNKEAFGVYDGAELDELASSFKDLSENLGNQLKVAALERSRLDQTLAASADVIIAIDSVSTVVYVNEAATHILTISEDSVLGRPLLSVLVDHEIHELTEVALAGQDPDPRIIWRDDRQYQAVARRIIGDGLWAVVLVMHDVTAMQEAEAARREFVADVSHELRTPIASISAAVETLGTDLGADDAKHFREVIQSETGKMAQTIEEMIELARLESGIAQPQCRLVDLNYVIDEAVSRMSTQANHAGLSLSFERSSDSLRICADPDLVYRALLNLLHNAVQFTPHSGHVLVSTRSEEEQIWLLVRDNGVGLSEEDRVRVFRRFYRADRARRLGGTGLGLALVRHIAEAHMGKVSVESKLGSGSIFGFSLSRDMV